MPCARSHWKSSGAVGRARAASSGFSIHENPCGAAMSFHVPKSVAVSARGRGQNERRSWFACSHTLSSLCRKSIRFPVEISSPAAASLTRASTACSRSSTNPTTGQSRGSLRPRCNQPCGNFEIRNSKSAAACSSRSRRKKAWRNRLRALALFSCCERLSSAMTIRPLAGCRMRTAELVLLRSGRLDRWPGRCPPRTGPGVGRRSIRPTRLVGLGSWLHSRSLSRFTLQGEEEAAPWKLYKSIG